MATTIAITVFIGLIVLAQWKQLHQKSKTRSKTNY